MSRLDGFGEGCRAGMMALGAGFLVAICAFTHDAAAYTAAGDRLFPATVVLPQISPGDEFYLWASTQPFAAGSELSEFNGTYMKTITENLGIVVQDTWARFTQSGSAKPLYGWLNFDTEIKYLAINNQAHEFLLTLGLDREWGGTGASWAASPSSATTPRLYFGKGLGDLDIGYLRPLAITGLLGYQIADKAPRPDLVTPGFVVEYSIPYLQSKVQSLPLPEIIRGLTPMTEVSFTIPAGKSFGARTTALICPGISYAGQGYEFLVEALVPATHATASGVGVVAMVHFSLDYLFPDTIGRPLLSQR
jgi:hypothetical protein